MNRLQIIHKLATRASSLAGKIDNNAEAQGLVSLALDHIGNAERWTARSEYDWQEALNEASELLDQAAVQGSVKGKHAAPVADYLTAVALIAGNDDPGETRLEFVAGTVSVGIIASLFGTTAKKVARDVVKVRKNYGLDR